MATVGVKGLKDKTINEILVMDMCTFAVFQFSHTMSYIWRLGMNVSRLLYASRGNCVDDVFQRVRSRLSL